MSFWLNQTIPLSARTFHAWKEQGGKFFTPERDNDYIKNIVCQTDREEEFFLNLGNPHLNALRAGIGGLPVWNNGPDTVWSLNTPVRTRELFHDLMAPQTGETEYVWVKEAGWGGRGKERLLTAEANLDDLPYWEDHIEGDEYRVITVGDLRVQQFKREGENGAREYEWVPMRELPDNTKHLLKEAVRRLPRRSVIGWDVIVQPGGRVVLLEGNTTPGVNAATAERIVNAIRNKEREYAI